MTVRFAPERIEQWPLDRLVAYPRNPRTHSDGQVARIAASMVEFGWTNPVLVSREGEVIAGHGRLEAARKLGLETNGANLRHIFPSARPEIAAVRPWPDPAARSGTRPS